MAKKDTVSSGGAQTKAIMCGCPSAYQDQRYGLGMRLHNKTKNGYRCTGCNKDKGNA